MVVHLITIFFMVATDHKDLPENTKELIKEEINKLSSLLIN